MRVRWICLLLGIAVSCGSGASSGTAPSTDREPQWLTSALTADHTDDGWPLPTGTWATNVFGQTILFDTPSDLTLVAEDDQLVYLATPGNRNLIMIARTTGMWNGSADVPVPEDADGMTAAWEANPANSVTASGEIEGAAPVPWWDITITEMTDFTYPCWLGLDCVFSTFGGDSKVHSLQGERLRSYARNDIEIGLGVHVAGSAIGIDAAVQVADQIAASLRIADGALASKSEQKFLGTHTETGLPAGPVVAPADEQALHFDLAEPRPDIQWISHLGGIELYSEQGSLMVAAPILVDPDVPPTFCPPSQTSPPQGLPAYVTDTTNSAAEFEDYLRIFTEIEGSGETEILGEVATWWDLGDPMDGHSVECPGPGGTTNVSFFLAVQEGGLPHAAGEGGTSRVHRLHPSGLMIAVSSFEVTDDPLAPFQEVLEAMSVS